MLWPVHSAVALDLEWETMGSLGHHDHLTHHGVQTETQLRHDLNKTANGPWFYVAKCRGLFFVTIRFFCRIHYYALSHLRPPDGTIPRQPCGVWTVLLCPGRQADGCIGCFWARRCRITGLCRQLARLYCKIYTYRSIRGLYTQLSKAGLTSVLAIMISSATASPATDTEPSQHCWYGVELADFPG